MNKTIEIGALITLILAIVSGAFFIGRLDQRISTIEGGDSIDRLKEEIETLRVNTIKEIESATLSGVPIGSIVSFYGKDAQVPDGYLVCDGTQFSKERYPELFDLLVAANPSLREGNGVASLPNLAGRVLVGSGASKEFTNRTLGDHFGSETHTLTIREIPSHMHSGNVSTGGYSAEHHQSNPRLPIQTWKKQTGATGGGQAHNIMQPSYVVSYLIRAE